MIPVGHQPILWHVMQYYSQYGHKDFVLCLGYKANVIKDFFLNYQPQTYADCVVSGCGKKVEMLGDARKDWRVTLIDTGIWRNIGERLWAVREHVKDEEMFLANYSDGLTDVDLDDMIETFKKSGKVACFLAVRPPLTYHLADIAEDGRVREFRTSDTFRNLDQWRLLHLPPEIFDYMQRRRGAGARAVHAADRRKQAHGLQARGLLALDGHAARPASARGHGREGRHAVARSPQDAARARAADHADARPRASGPRSFRSSAIGAHSDDIEIGAGGTILSWIAAGGEPSIGRLVRLERRRARAAMRRAQARRIFSRAPTAKSALASSATAISRPNARRSRTGSKR